MNSRVLQTVLVTVFVGIFVPVLAQKNYYVVVGAFSTEGDARELTTLLPVMNADTAYAMNDQEHVVQLYVLRTSSADVATEKSATLRASLEEFKGGYFENYESISISELPEGRSVSFHKGIAEIDSESLASDASGSRAPTVTEGGMSAAAAARGSNLFKFIIKGPDGNHVPGQVHFVDFEKERELGTYETSKYTDVMRPARYHSDLAFVCAVFGYKQTEKHLSYDNPNLVEGAYVDETGAWVVPYELERLTKGDVSVMYNVVFHKDAVVMLPQSVADLEELLKMMNENPDYEITIHGHTNGKHERKILAPGPHGDLFDISEAKSVFGSAKKLSMLRGEAVKDYLVKNGIDAKRIRVFAWGGRLMLAEPESSHARLNDRIEIEIRKD